MKKTYTRSATNKKTEHTCIECGKPFMGIADAKMCSNNCRVKNHRKKQKEKGV